MIKMCLACPGKIVKIEKDIVTVDYGTEKRKAKIIDSFNIGDYVIVQNKIVIQKIPKKDAEEFIRMICSMSRSTKKGNPNKKDRKEELF